MKNESFLKQIEFHVRSGNSGLWVVSHEATEVVRTLLALQSISTEDGEGKIRLVQWDAIDGCRNLDAKDELPLPQSKDPVALLQHFRGNSVLVEEGEGFVAQLILLHNFHFTLDNAVVKQTLINAIQEGKPVGTIYIVLSPKSEMPLEFQHLMTQIDFLPPDVGEIQKIINGVDVTMNRGEVVDAVLGLTRREVEQTVSMGSIRHSFRTPGPESDHLLIEDLWDSKEQVLRQKPFLKLLRSKKGFDSLGGLHGIKSFSKKIMEPDDELPAKGELLLGPPGTGKSAFARALGFETNRAVIQLDMGAVFNKHVGDSEANTRDALNTVGAMGPIILFVDEVEKALSGSSGEGDSGVSARVFGTLLTWLSDRAEAGSEVFFIATSNDISRLPPEFSRAGRFDRIFFLDLPNEEERDEIWKQYCLKFQIPWEQSIAVKDALWTGAEIEQCCYLARKLRTTLHEVSSEIVPVSETYAEQITRLRESSNNRYVCARTGKRYQFSSSSSGGMVTPSSLAGKRRNLLTGGKEQPIKEI